MNAVAAPAEFNIRDYFAAVTRRHRLLLGTMLGIFVFAGLLALLLPAIYRSEAVILIEQQEIPTDMVRSTVTSYADQRIQVISQRVMTSSNLTEIIEKFDLYEEERKRDPIQIVMDEMRLDITLDIISADVVDPRSGKPTQATIAFRLAFESPSPDLAQKVANELVSLYLNENIKSRTEAAAETSTFLTDEAENLRQRVAQFETELADFKAENLQNRPELENITREIINRTELELNSTEQRLYAAQEQEIYLEAELQKVGPTIVGDTPVEVGAMQRLLDVEAQLAAAEAAYSERHPDIKRLRKQAEAMRAEIEPEEARELFERQLSAARQSLAALLETYAIDHPDVQVARELVSNLEIKLAAVPDPGEVDPDNAAYIHLASRLQAARAEIRTLGDKREILIAKVAEYTDNLLRTPDIEAEYRAIQREYETALLKYQEITAKQIEARLSESLENENKGERFTLIEPPLRPEEPAAPNRLAILLVGAFLSLTGGFGSVGMAEAMDTRVRGRRGVQGLLAAPPLAVIPYIYGSESVIKRHRSTFVVVGIAVLVAIIGLLAIHFLWKPLDVIWFILLRKIGL